MSNAGRDAQTPAGLRADLEALGVRQGMTLVVHSSLSAIGWVEGGAASVVRALLESLGQDGTLAMPAATPGCGDPIFDRRTTPTSMGAIPETFRVWPGTLRSDHPLESVCARGPLAEEITRKHPLHFSEGPGTPFDRMHDHDARILLVGVGFDRCTALHYAESLVENRRTMKIRFPRLEDDRRVWVEILNVADDNGAHFPAVGDRFLASGLARTGRVGQASSTLFAMRDLVRVASAYFREAL